MNIRFANFIIITLGFILISGCGNAPQKPPSMLYGSVRIKAQINSQMVDSMEVFIDGQTQGIQRNPCLLENLEPGRHQFSVAKMDPTNPIDFTSSPKLVLIKGDSTTDVAFELTKLAPNFTLKNLNNEEITLENYRGKVIFMVFYSNT